MFLSFLFFLVFLPCKEKFKSLFEKTELKINPKRNNFVSGFVLDLLHFLMHRILVNGAGRRYI